MDIIQDSAEHHFLTFLEKRKHAPGQWYAIHIGLSRRINHESLIKSPDTIPKELEATRQKRRSVLEDIKPEVEGYKKCAVYCFKDGDLIVLAEMPDNAGQEKFRALFKELCEKLNPKICDYSSLSENIYKYEKIADRKFLSALKMASYKAMADRNRISSIPVRRKKRKAPTVMVVEDDRFTASCAANFLSKDYELIYAKNGEEAIINYIEGAPDMVFLDIHLPGLDGHETLYAIRQIDPDAFVIMLSVDAVKSNIVTATKYGAAGFLKKPFTKERMIVAAEKLPFMQEARKQS
jgi:CheY-like chemotaxis protein